MKKGVVLVLALTTGLLGLPDADAEAPADPVRAAADRLRQEAGPGLEMSLHRTTGVAQLVRMAPGSVLVAGKSATARSLSFLREHGAVFGVDDPDRQLEVAGTRIDRLGHRHLRLSQRFEGLPVLGGELRAHIDADDRLYAVGGVFIPGVSVNPVPTVSPADAAAIAVAVVAKNNPGVARGRLVASDAELAVERAGLARGKPGEDHLVWAFEVTNGGAIRDVVRVDAHDGSVVERAPGIHHLTRVVSERTESNIVWSEGDPLPYSGSGAEADLEINRLIDVAEVTYRFFLNLSGGTFVSWDGHDGVMRSVYDTQDFECDTNPNASWNGSRTAFCPDMTDEDTIAHEWTHAYTESTHGLGSIWQSGALNESYSDIFGETVDLLSAIGTDVPDLPRGAGECSVFAVSDFPNLLVSAPSSVQGVYLVSGAEFNPPPPWDITAAVEMADDGTVPTGDACEALVGFTPGRIALIDRGDCNFIEKVKRAEDAGAVGAIVVNNEGETWVNMGRPEGDATVITIPSAFLRQSDGETLKDALDEGLQARLFTVEGTDPSVRWVQGEDTILEGIRDMWNPNCLGDPETISDPLYRCALDQDSGGIHSNCGVPNRAYSLLVDGGSFNGRTVEGIGLTKAAHIYWRAMANYQVSLTDFALHADLLEVSCADLAGQTLTDLLTGAPSPEVVTESDCGQLTQAIAAVEMRAMPSCEFPITVLDPGAPVLQGNRVAFSESFDGGTLPGWSFSHEGVHAEYVPRDWQWTADLPEGGSSGALFALNSPLVGDCEPGSDDQSGVVRATSPEITVPPGRDPMLAFDHWIASERSRDGGNLKISVNGGDYQLVEEQRFLYNPYNGALRNAEAGNTNPLAGEAAFSGTDWGTARGSWGQSQVDLEGLVAAGDTLRVRFDFGVDGCVGAFGWYVDNLQVRTTDRAPRAVAGRRPLP
jgi:Zn-dependent metalloprotease